LFQAKNLKFRDILPVFPSGKEEDCMQTGELRPQAGSTEHQFLACGFCRHKKLVSLLHRQRKASLFYVTPNQPPVIPVSDLMNNSKFKNSRKLFIYKIATTTRNILGSRLVLVINCQGEEMKHI